MDECTGSARTRATAASADTEKALSSLGMSVASPDSRKMPSSSMAVASTCSIIDETKMGTGRPSRLQFSSNGMPYTLQVGMGAECTTDFLDDEDFLLPPNSEPRPRIPLDSSACGVGRAVKCTESRSAVCLRL